MLLNCGGRNPAIIETEAGDPLFPSLSAASTVSKYSLLLANGKPVVLIQPVFLSTSNLASPPKKTDPQTAVSKNTFT